MGIQHNQQFCRKLCRTRLHAKAVQITTMHFYLNKISNTTSEKTEIENARPFFSSIWQELSLYGPLPIPSSASLVLCFLMIPFILYEMGPPRIKYMTKMLVLYLWMTFIALFMAIPVAVWRQIHSGNAEVPTKVINGFNRFLGKYAIRKCGDNNAYSGYSLCEQGSG